jgi:dipeptidase E
VKKLMLYSDQVPTLRNTADEALKKLIGKPHPGIGFIPSAGDPERHYFNDRKSFYNGLGADLSVYFELDEEWQPERLNTLLNCDAIHLSGGNTYYFLTLLRKRNMIPVLTRYVAKGGVLIGVSAGSILMTPDITTSSICGDDMIPGETDFSGLRLVDFAFVPHYGSKPGMLEDIKKYARKRKQAVYAARDTGAIMVENDKISCIGDVLKIE